MARLDTDAFVDGAVLEPAGHVDEHVAAREPSLAGAVDAGVGDVPEPDVAADIDVPGPEVGVHVVVVTVGLERHPQGAAEMHSARDGAPCGRVEHPHVHPVPSRVSEL